MCALEAKLSWPRASPLPRDKRVPVVSVFLAIKEKGMHSPLGFALEMSAWVMLIIPLGTWKWSVKLLLFLFAG